MCAREAVCPLFDFCASQFRPRWGAICSSGHKENIFTVQKIGFGREPDLSREQHWWVELRLCLAALPRAGQGAEEMSARKEVS